MATQQRQTIRASAPSPEGDGRIAVGDPGWGGGRAAAAPQLLKRCHPLPARWRGPTSPQPNLAIAGPLNKVTEVGNSRLRLGEVTTPLKDKAVFSSTPSPRPAGETQCGHAAGTAARARIPSRWARRGSRSRMAVAAPARPRTGRL